MFRNYHWMAMEDNQLWSAYPALHGLLTRT
jgi:hypothetical protein